jgi:hypothetical protein
LTALAALFLIGGAQAVHDDNLFELGPAQGANILGDGSAANGPDWADIFDANGNDVGSATFGGLAATFIKDDTSQKGDTDKTTFSGAGGSNKNNDPISNADCASRVPPLTGGACDTWHWDAGNVPAKDDLVNSYAYAAMPTSGPLTDDLILYTGLERLDPAGDSHVDIEFLQNPVNIVDGQPAASGQAAVPCNDPGNDPVPCEFSGIREVGDVIISMDFVNGGGIGEVDVHEWNGTEYVLQGTAGGEGCNAADSICAFNNGGLIDGGPWPNFNKSGSVITQIEQNGFTEIGVNVTDLLGFTPCISTIMAKTRSSQSFTAELKDFTAPKAFPICGANIQITPDAVNKVGDSHTFNVNVNKTIGNDTVPAPDGTIVTVTLTDANGAVHNISANTCANPGTVNGTCHITFKSDTAGTVTGHAAADVDIGGGETRHVETNGQGSNSGDAIKRFVDARISIGPDDTNSVREPHTFTVTVEQNDGLTAAQGGDGVSGFGPAPNGTIPTVTLTDSGGAISNISNNTCTSGTTGGTCSITFTSNTAGTVVGHATVTFSVSGVSLTRATDNTHGSSGDATKVFIAGSLAWFKNDHTGARLGGATFEVCRTADRFGNPVTGECVSVTDNTAPDTDTDPGEFKLLGLTLGHYTVRETQAPPGFEGDPSTKSADLTIAAPDATISVAFVNNRPILKISGFGYTNVANGTPTAGVVNGTATYTVGLHNYGGAAAVLSNSSLAVSVTGAGAGTVTCGSPPVPTPVTVPITGTVAAGGNLTPPFTLACTYSNMADGAVITAVLNVNYTTNGVQRAASGSPATVSFTVQAD